MITPARLLPIALFALAPFLAQAETYVDDPADADGWFDITVLTAKVHPGVTLKQYDQVENCAKVRDEWKDYGRGGWRHIESFDCTAYIEGKLNATAFKPLPQWTFTNGHLDRMRLDDPILEVLTVTPVDRLARADYLGFSESSMGARVNLFKANGPEGKTREIGRVTLKDGRIGIVHRWIAAFESTGGGSGKVMRHVPFKPVLAIVRDGVVTRYWDRLIGTGMFSDYSIKNYEFGQPGPDYLKIVEPNEYDRTLELLK